MSNVKISELETTSAVSTSDLMETAIPSGSSYASKKMSIAQLATYLENSVVHSALDTQNKTIIDAINELKSICDRLSASHFIVANQLPTSDINMNAIYLIPKQSTEVNDVYEEFICLDDTTTPATWEKIGETQIDLSNYITFDDADIATTSKNGSMSKADRSKLNGIDSGAQKNVQSDWNAASGDAFIKNKPTIPTVNDGTLTITQNGTSMGTFTANQSSAGTIEVKDEKVSQEKSTSTSYFPILFANSTTDTTETAKVQKNLGLTIRPSTANLVLCRDHTGTTTSDTQLTIGNNIDNGSAGSVRGYIKLYGKNTHYTNLFPSEASNDLSYYLPKDRPNYSELAVVEQTAVSLELALDADLNDVLTVGFYVGKGGNTCTNKPSGVIQFGLCVVKLGTANTYYKQILIQPRTVANGGSRTYTRALYQSTWTDWIEEKYTDENVKQSPIASSNYDYPLLMAYSANGTEETQAVWKNTNLTFNPSTSVFKTYRADLGELQCTLIDFGVGSNIYGTLHGSLASSHVDVYLPVASGELALEEWQNRIGSMNLIPQNTAHKSGRVSAGATFTVNEDGTITVDRTSPTSVDATFELSQRVINGGLWLPNGTYYMSGCPSGGSSSNYYLGIRRTKNGAQDTLGDDFGSGVTFTINGDDYGNNGAWVRVVIAIKGNKAVSNQLWKPMITLTSLANTNTYYPPSMSNRQLTFYKFDNSNVATIENTNTASRAYAVNEFMIWHGALYRVKSAMASGATISTTYVEATTLSAQLKQIRDALGI